ncbi:MAG TPA: DUF1028 domain-containing protein [Candidatus Limnocylindrales bacterium]|jgi:uncharacterized Ntn-hydrolase superfamily protein
MTYSIVARDAQSGRFGVAVQTCWPFVGAGVPWVESGVGAVATQSYTEEAHGPNGLALLRSGVSASDAMARLLEADPGREVRQVGIVDATGGSASWTGARCVPAAGHATTDGIAIQANMMERPTVWPAMLAAFQAPAVSFVDRLLAALRAAEKEGGDIRGRQAAALLVSGTPDEPAWTRQYDIRVDDHPAPLDELERLVRVHLGYDALARAEELGRSGDLEGAARAGDEASRLAPGDGQIVVWRAIGTAAGGMADAGRMLLIEATATNPRWPEFVRRVAESGAQPELEAAARAIVED